ncbi:MAG TPA: hypothetical protein VEM14_03290 [Gemmatimonadaceae bacterium]|nr:hypothetical protein [Gemmatimonadaceae bacterium]
MPETKLDADDLEAVETLVGNWERNAPMFAAVRARTGCTLTQVMLLYVLASMPDADDPEPWQAV